MVVMAMAYGPILTYLLCDSAPAPQETIYSETKYLSHCARLYIQYAANGNGVLVPPFIRDRTRRGPCHRHPITPRTRLHHPLEPAEFLYLHTTEFVGA